MSASFSIETPAVPGAVAVIRVRSGRVDLAFDAMGCAPVDLGDARVRRVFGIDDALVACPEPGVLLVMPHGGPAVLCTLRHAMLGAAWSAHEPDSEPSMQDRLSDALARAASPLAIDLLLDQPRRWNRRTPEDGLADGRVLGRLIDPPTVAAVGRANIGKSSLLNALAGRCESLVFDRAGTTRDAVGVLIDAGGLVVRWLDTPGLTGEPSTASVVRAACAEASLVLRCRDCADENPPVIEVAAPTIDVVLRTDRDEPSGPGVRTSAVSGRGRVELIARIRETLVPSAVLEDPRAWAFWERATQPRPRD